MAVECLDLSWQLHSETRVTSDLWGMDKPGNKNRDLLCGSKGKHLLDWRWRRKGGGCFNSRGIIIWPFQTPLLRGGWREGAESHCTFHHYDPNPLYFTHWFFGRLLAQQKEKMTRKEKEEFLWYERCSCPYRITTGADGSSSSFIFKLNWSPNKWSKRIPDHGVDWRKHSQTALALIASCIVMINECLNCLILQQGRVQYHLNVAAGTVPTQEAKDNKRNTLAALNANSADI